MRPLPVLLLETHGYDETSTKNMTQQRKTGGKADATVTFLESMKVTLKKEVFISNPRNKQRFINMKSSCLQQNNCQKYQAKGDADVLIVKTGVESAQEKNTVVVGEDTDLLVLLCFYVRLDSWDGAKAELQKTCTEYEDRYEAVRN